MYMRKTIAIVIFGTYSFLSIFGLMSFHYSNHHLGIMTSDCPETICIDFFKDISTWKNISNSILPIFKIIFFLGILSIFYCFCTFKINTQKILFYIYVKSRLPNNLYQFLFSQGILNSKVF